MSVVLGATHGIFLMSPLAGTMVRGAFSSATALVMEAAMGGVESTLSFLPTHPTLIKNYATDAYA